VTAVSTPSIVGLFRGAFDEPVRLDSERLRAARRKEMLIRFAFGFAASVCAGLVSLGAGDRAGGLFLAFPAILPASLTLIGKKENRRQAEVDAGGALLGAVALVVFAVVAWQALGRVPPAGAEAGALVAWLITSVGSYAAIRALVRRRTDRAAGR
jgi:hypothetical protein